LGILIDESVIGITCQLTDVKYVQNLINAFSTICKTESNLKLVIAGEGYEKEKLIAITKKLNLEDKIIFAGYIKDAFLYASIYDIATLVSQIEGFPNSIVEYLAVGKAVVVTNVGGNSEIIKDNYNGFLVPFNDENALVEKIKILLNNSDKKTQFEKNAIKTIKNDFTEDKMVENIEKFFQKILQ